MKRRAGLPVDDASASACASSTAISSTSRALRARPNTKSTRLLFAPGHQRFAGEAGIGAQQDARARPARPDLCDDPRDLLLRAGAAVDVRRPELGRQQMPAAEHIERQIAVAIVVAVKEPAFLMAVQRVVGRVEVEDDLLGRLCVRLEEEVDKQGLDRRRVVAIL